MDDDFEDSEGFSIPSVDELLALIKSGHKDQAVQVIKAVPFNLRFRVLEKLARHEGKRTNRLCLDITTIILDDLNFDLDHHIELDEALEIGDDMEQEAMDDFAHAFTLIRELGYDLNFDFSQPRGAESARELTQTLKEARAKIDIIEIPILLKAAIVNQEYYTASIVDMDDDEFEDDSYLQKLSDTLHECEALTKQSPSDIVDTVAQVLQALPRHNTLPSPSRK
jgi:hypothetical protein